MPGVPWSRNLNVSYEEAVKRGWVQPEDVPKSAKGRSSVRNGKTAAVRAAEDGAPATRLWNALKDIPGAVQEYTGAVPGRKFRIDIAFPQELNKLCVECDGWEWHGKHKGDFQRDRERQNLLTIAGWRILRFSAKDIRGDLPGCVAQVQLALGLTHA